MHARPSIALFETLKGQLSGQRFRTAALLLSLCRRPGASTLVDAMIRLEKALKPHIQKLAIEAA